MGAAGGGGARRGTYPPWKFKNMVPLQKNSLTRKKLMCKDYNLLYTCITTLNIHCILMSHSLVITQYAMHVL